MKISEAFDAYGKYMVLEGKSQRSIETNYYIKRRLIETVGDIKISKLTLDDIFKWKRVMFFRIAPSGTTLKRMPNSLRYDTIALRNVLKYMEKIGIKCLDYQLVPIPKREDVKRDVLCADEVALMIDNAFSLRNKFIISLLYSSGIRLSEFLMLNRNDINDRQFTVIGKGKKERLCFIDERTEKLMGEYLASRKDDCRALVVTNLYKQRMTATTVQLIIKNSIKRAGIDKHITPHSLRHSFATNFVKNNGGIKPLSEMLGHNSLDTTAIYTHLANEELKSQYRQFHTT